MTARLDPSGLVFDHAINMNTGRMACDPQCTAPVAVAIALDEDIDEDAQLAKLVPHFNRL
jgi:hypothetical protein